MLISETSLMTILGIYGLGYLASLILLIFMTRAEGDVTLGELLKIMLSSLLSWFIFIVFGWFTMEDSGIFNKTIIKGKKNENN